MATANGDTVDFEFFNKYTIPGSRIVHNQFHVNNANLVGLQAYRLTEVEIEKLGEILVKVQA